jgi:tetratricopeptide (TPR) repeat protein
MIVTIDRNTDWKNNFVLWRQTIEVAPTNVKARHNLARQILAKQSVISDKDRNEVIQHLEKSITLARELPGDEFFEPYVNLGQVYIQEGILAMKSGKNTDDSRRFFNKAVDCLLEGIHRSQFRGRRYESWKETISRKQDLLNNITIEFGDAKLYLNLATALDALGRTPEVIKQLHNAIKTEPFNPEGYIRLALVYAREGDHVQAKAVLNMVERLNISNKEQLFLLAKIYTNLGNYEKARLLLEKVNQTELQTKK